MMKNFILVMINHGVHDSVGAQKINSKNLNYQKISEGFGYDKFFRASTLTELNKALDKALKINKSVFVEILSTAGTINNLLRPKEKFLFRKNEFKKLIKKNV